MNPSEKIDPTLHGSLAMLARLNGWNMAVTQEPGKPIVVAFTERNERRTRTMAEWTPLTFNQFALYVIGKRIDDAALADEGLDLAIDGVRFHVHRDGIYRGLAFFKRSKETDDDS